MINIYLLTLYRLVERQKNEKFTSFIKKRCFVIDLFTKVYYICNR